MREILFRGKTIGGDWVEGLPYYAHETGTWSITHSNGWLPSYSNPDEGESTVFTEVIPSTIGQFTGLHDRDGKRIFEGDKVVRDDTGSPFYMGAGEPKTIIYNPQSARFHAEGTLFDNLYEYCHSASGKNVSTIIGNIHES